MPRLPGISHIRVVKAFKKAGFSVVREGQHIAMTNGERIIIIPRENPIHSYTMGGIIKDAGLTMARFKKLLSTGWPHKVTASHDLGDAPQSATPAN